PGETPGVRGEVLLQTLRLGQNSACVLQQGSAGRGGGDTATSTHQERGSKGQLHLADAGRGRRKRQIGTCRTMGDTARLDDMAEQVEVGKIEPHEGPPSYSTKAGYIKSILR